MSLARGLTHRSGGLNRITLRCVRSTVHSRFHAQRRFWLVARDVDRHDRAFWAVVIYGIVLLRGPWRTGTEVPGGQPRADAQASRRPGAISIDEYRQ